MPSTRPTRNQGKATAKGGGQATTTGIAFQAQVAAKFAADLISERQLDERLRLGSARASLLRLETEAPIDDILIQTDADGFIFIQAKTSVNLSQGVDSGLGKVAQQRVKVETENAVGTALSVSRMTDSSWLRSWVVRYGNTRSGRRPRLGASRRFRSSTSRPAARFVQVHRAAQRNLAID